MVCAGVFAAASINGARLIHLTDADLMRMGVADSGRRQPLLHAIETLHAEHVFYGVGGRRDRSAQPQSPLPPPPVPVSMRTRAVSASAGSGTASASGHKSKRLTLPYPPPVNPMALLLGPAGTNNHLRDTSVPALRDLLEPPPSPFPIGDMISGSGLASAHSGSVTLAPGFVPPRPTPAPQHPNALPEHETDPRIHKQSTLWIKSIAIICVVISMTACQWLVLGGEMHRFSYVKLGVNAITGSATQSHVSAICYWDRYETYEYKTDVTSNWVSPIPGSVLRSLYWHAATPTETNSDSISLAVQENEHGGWCFWCAAQAVTAFGVTSWGCSAFALLMFSLRQFDRRSSLLCGLAGSSNAPRCCLWLISEHFWWHTIEWLLLAIAGCFQLLVVIIWAVVCMTAHTQYLSDAFPSKNSGVKVTGYVFVCIGTAFEVIATILWRIHKRRDERAGRRMLMAKIDAEQQRKAADAAAALAASSFPAVQTAHNPVKDDMHGSDEIGLSTAIGSGGISGEVEMSNQFQTRSPISQPRVISINVQPAAAATTNPTASPPPPPPLQTHDARDAAKCADTILFLVVFASVIIALALLSGGSDLHRYSYSFDIINPNSINFYRDSTGSGSGSGGFGAADLVYTTHSVKGRAYWNRACEQEKISTFLTTDDNNLYRITRDMYAISCQYYNEYSSGDDDTIDTTAPVVTDVHEYKIPTWNETSNSTYFIIIRNATNTVISGIAIEDRRHQSASLYAASIWMAVFICTAILSGVLFLIMFGFRAVLKNHDWLSARINLDRLSEAVMCRRICQRPAPPPNILAAAIQAAGGAGAANSLSVAASLKAELAVMAAISLEYYFRWERAWLVGCALSFLLLTSVWGGVGFAIDRSYINKWWIPAAVPFEVISGEARYTHAPPTVFGAAGMRSGSAGDGLIGVTWLGVVSVTTVALAIVTLYLIVAAQPRDRRLAAALALSTSDESTVARQQQLLAEDGDVATDGLVPTGTIAVPGSGAWNAVLSSSDGQPQPASVESNAHASGSGGLGTDGLPSHATRITLPLPPAQQHDRADATGLQSPRHERPLVLVTPPPSSSVTSGSSPSPNAVRALPTPPPPTPNASTPSALPSAAASSPSGGTGINSMRLDGSGVLPPAANSSERRPLSVQTPVTGAASSAPPPEAAAPPAPATPVTPAMSATVIEVGNSPLEGVTVTPASRRFRPAEITVTSPRRLPPLQTPRSAS